MEFFWLTCLSETTMNANNKLDNLLCSMWLLCIGPYVLISMLVQLLIFRFKHSCAFHCCALQSKSIVNFIPRHFQYWHV